MARVAFDPRGAHAMLPSPDGKPLRLELSELPRVPVLASLGELSRLPAETRIFVGPKDARIVLHGAIADANVIGAALRSFDQLGQHASSAGPIARVA